MIQEQFLLWFKLSSEVSIEMERAKQCDQQLLFALRKPERSTSRPLQLTHFPLQPRHPLNTIMSASESTILGLRTQILGKLALSWTKS